MCSMKKVLLKISPNSQENSSLKKRCWHRYFPVSFSKFLRTTFFTEHLLETTSGFWFQIDFDCYPINENINYILLYYLNLQLTTYTANRSLQKVINLLVRHLTRPHFLESCGYELLL